MSKAQLEQFASVASAFQELYGKPETTRREWIVGTLPGKPGAYLYNSAAELIMESAGASAFVKWVEIKVMDCASMLGLASPTTFVKISALQENYSINGIACPSCGEFEESLLGLDCEGETMECETCGASNEFRALLA